MYEILPTEELNNQLVRGNNIVVCGMEKVTESVALDSETVELQKFKEGVRRLTISTSKHGISTLIELAKHCNEHKIIKALNECENDLLLLYTLDALMKQIGGTYIDILSCKLPKVFQEIFERNVENVSILKKFFNLRCTWKGILSEDVLCKIDKAVNEIDNGWPIQCSAADGSVNVSKDSDSMKEGSVNTTRSQKDLLDKAVNEIDNGWPIQCSAADGSVNVSKDSDSMKEGSGNTTRSQKDLQLTKAPAGDGDASLATQSQPGSRRGRPPKNPIELRERRFSELKDKLICNGEMVSSSNEIYRQIAAEFQVEKQTIYLAVKRYLKKKRLVQTEDEIQDKDADVDNDDFIPIEYFGNDFELRRSDISIQLNIIDVNLFYNAIDELNITAEWSDTFSSILWEFFKLPCAWRFERIREVCNEVVIVGKCRSMECARVFGYTQENKKTLKIRVRSFNEEAVHVKKSTIKNARREILDKMLSTNTACVVQSKLTNDLMSNADDYVPALIPTTMALSKQKSRANQTKFLHENPVLAICEMKKQNIYHDIIGDIGMDPFYVFYCTPLQEELVLSRTRYRRTIISFDSSGLPEKDIMFSSVSEDDKDVYKDCFLYVVSLQSPDGNLPAFQFITQRQNTDFIQYSCACWKSKHFTKKNPDEAIMDHSNALLLSSVQCFTSCKTMHLYLNNCYDALFNNRPPPRCYIRLNRSHMVKEILHLPCFKNEDKRRKRLYQRIFGFLMTIESITSAEDIITKMFIILLNKYENDPFVSSAKVFLKNISEKHSIPDPDGDNNEDFNTKSIQEEEEDIFASESKFRVWIQSKITAVKEQYVNESLNCSIHDEDDNLIDNLYYAPNLEKPFVDFLVRLPLFSNVMNKTFGSTNTVPTSSPTEVGFHIIKNLVLNTNRKIRIDFILQQHIDFLRGNLNAKRTNNPKHDETYNPIGENLKFDADCASLEENWKNKNIDAKPKRKIPEKRCINSILNPSKPYSRFIPILKNGHCTIGTKKIAGIISRLTCAFDSIFQVLAACYVDNSSFGKTVEADDSDLSCLLKTLFTNNDVYRLRNEMLVGLLPEKVTKHDTNVLYLDGEIGIQTMFMRMASNYTIAQSYNESRKCHACNFVSPKMGKAFIPIILSQFEISNTQEAITFNDKNKDCPNCSGTTQICREFNDVVAMECTKNSVNLSTIAQKIMIGNRLYVIKGVIGYTTRHFIAHIHRSNGEWETYDGLSPAKIRKTPKLVCPVQLFFTFQGDKTTEDTKIVKLDINGETIAGRNDMLLSTKTNLLTDCSLQVENLDVDTVDVIHSDLIIATNAAEKYENVSGKRRADICEERDSKKRKSSNAQKENVPKNTVSVQHSLGYKNTHRTLNTLQTSAIENKLIDTTSTLQIPPLQINEESNEISIDQIRILPNGVDNVLTNTCSFDAITQILAAAYALHIPYRNVARRSKDKIFQIAALLSQKDAKTKINSARSILLLQLFCKVDYALVTSEMLSKVLTNTPSAREFMSCSHKNCEYKHEISRPYLSMAMDVFDGKMENIELSILANYYLLVDCISCKRNLCVSINREFGDHLFVEMPISSIKPNKNNYEEIVTYSLDQLKVTITLNDKRYFLFGLVLFQPPQLKNSIGHYVAAVKVCDEYFVFDGLRESYYRLEKESELVIDCLFYVHEDMVLNSLET